MGHPAFEKLEAIRLVERPEVRERELAVRFTDTDDIFFSEFCRASFHFELR